MTPADPCPDPGSGTDVREGHLPVKGGRIWWRLHSPLATGTPLVVLHGGPGMPAYYLESLAILADRRPVLFFDQPGCGRSPLAPGTEVSLEMLAAHVHALVTHLDLDNYVLLGHSFGGMLALESWRQDPSGCAGLVLSSPLVSTARWIEDVDRCVAALPAQVQAWIRQPRNRQEQDAGEDRFYREFFCRLDPWPGCLQRTMDETSAGVYQRLWGTNEFSPSGDLLRADLSAVTRSISVPTLWMCGSRDEVLPETLASFAAGVPLAEVVVLDGGSHCAHLEQPAAYEQALRSYLSRIDPTRVDAAR